MAEKCINAYASNLGYMCSARYRS